MYQFYFFHGHFDVEGQRTEFCEVIKVAKQLDPTEAYRAIIQRVADVMKVDVKIVVVDQFNLVPYRLLG